MKRKYPDTSKTFMTNYIQLLLIADPAINIL